MRKIESITTIIKDNSNATNVFIAKLYRDAEWQEWRVKFYMNSVHLIDADYHTNKKLDAQGMARSWRWIQFYSA
jgi:hypothetical protein